MLYPLFPATATTLPHTHTVKNDQLMMMPTPSSCQEWFRSQAQSLLPTEEANQAMRFGDLPEWAVELSAMIAKVAEALGALPEEVR